MFFNLHTHSASGLAVVNYGFFDYIPESSGCISLGLHPWDTQLILTPTAFSADALTAACSDERVVMIGECGIDRLHGGNLNLQSDIFGVHIQVSEALGLPLLIHCVKAYNEILQLHQRVRPQQPWIFHGFRGKPQLAQQILQHKNTYLSFGEFFNLATVRAVPLNRIFAETDTSNLPISEIYERLANARNMHTADLADNIALTANSMFPSVFK